MTGLTYHVGDNPESVSLLEIQERYADEYDELSREEKKDLVRNFAEEKRDTKKLARPTARGRIQDVTNIASNMRQLVRIIIFSPRSLSHSQRCV